MTHSRHLGGNRFEPLPRRFTHSKYHPSMVAGERALHDGDNFALVGAVADGNLPRLWAVMQADQSRDAARLLKEAESFLAKAALFIDGGATTNDMPSEAESASPSIEAAANGETPRDVDRLFWSETTCDLVIGKPTSVIVPDRGTMITSPLAGLRTSRYEFGLQGSTWYVVFEQERGTVNATVGAHYVAELLSRPGELVPVAHLLGVHPKLVQQAAGIPYPVLDQDARKALAMRLDQLRNAYPITPEIFEEIDEIENQLKRATMPGGRNRSFGHHKPKHNIRTQIRRFIRRLPEGDFGRFKHHLTAHIRTSDSFGYDPPPGFPHWVVR